MVERICIKVGQLILSQPVQIELQKLYREEISEFISKNNEKIVRRKSEKKMLNLCKNLLAKLYLWPLETSPSMKITSIFRYAVNLSIELIVFMALFIYVLQNLQDIDEATEPGFVCFAYLTSMFIYIWMISKKELISSSINHLEFCVNESNDFLQFRIWRFSQLESLISFDFSILLTFYFEFK